MAWQDTMVDVLRVLVNDVDATSYTDDRLEQLLTVAGRFVLQEMTFSQTFACDVSNADIIPDPTALATLDDSFVNLICLKAACILDRGEASLAAKRAIEVVDGKSSVKLTGIARSKLALLDKGWCSVYDDAKLEYQSGQVRVAGAAIMTPFRTYALGDYSLIRTPGRDIDLYF